MLSGSGQSWVVTGLTTTTSYAGTYSLMIKAGAGITDAAGNSLDLPSASSWVCNLALTFAGLPTRTRESVTSLTLISNANVTGMSLSNMKLFLGNRAISLRDAVIAGRDGKYVMTLPSRLTSGKGTYRLEVGGPNSTIAAGGVRMITKSVVTWQKI